MCATTSDRYAVIGHPIAHTLSPLIHTEFARLTGQAITYGTIDAPPERFDGVVRDFFAHGGCGLNVTIPHKGAAFAACDQVTMRARVAGAVNTLWRDETGALRGDVTDGDGLVIDLREHIGFALTGARILVLGAGGSVAGCLAPLLGAGPAVVWVANRTPRKAHALAANFAGFGSVHGCALDAVPDAPFDLVINATAASVGGQIPRFDRRAVAGACCYDLMYAPEDTPFTAWARARGARDTRTGIGMLVEQAALSFELWRGVRPDTASVRRLLAREHGFHF